MGSGSSKQDFREIAQHSRLDYKDLENLLKTFKSISKNGKINKDALKKTIEQKFGGMDPTFSNVLFNLFDRNGDKDIDFQEFCLAYGYLVNRSHDDVVNVSFKCLDLNGDGMVSKGELRSVVMMNKRMEKYMRHDKKIPLDKIQLDPKETSEIYAKADQLFNMLDQNGDGNINTTEFQNIVNGNEAIQKVFTDLLVKDHSVDFFLDKK
ncbi:hypothetical protein CYY_006511 [Polysphondylium violaceum]|uniref:EF-hand domain-containing protein n=1 Tax=Polysphondylium violaceum TaxID=133409 RepID=A0A8J4PQG1_9MYCE|nr:hypothetical protein CYY_006511 [Polysphondylium violaceum]